MNKKNIIYIIAFIFITFSLFPGKIFEQHKMMGLWFTEYKNVKSIYFFKTIENTENMGRLLAFDNNGGFVSYSFKVQDEGILLEDNSKLDSISFDSKDIMYYLPEKTSMSLILKRIKNPDLSNEIFAFIEGCESLIRNKEITDTELENLEKNIKKSIFWGKMSMSPGKYLGWLKKKQKIEWEKSIKNSEESKNLSAHYIVDDQSLDLITGKWLFNGKHRFIFTNIFVCETMGVKLYRLKMENRPAYKDYDMSYTILIHKDNGNPYLHLVYWQFEFQSPSRIEFKNNDKLITFYNDEIDGEAERIK